MRTWLVVLMGLVVAHANASAEPRTCVENYTQITQNLEKATLALKYDESAGRLGSVGGLGGFLVCLAKYPTLPTAVGCGLVFGSIALVSYYNYLPAHEQLKRVEFAGRLGRIYQTAKLDSAPISPDVELEITALAESLSVPQNVLVDETVRLMKSSALCDREGQPNVTEADFLELIQQSAVN